MDELEIQKQFVLQAALDYQPADDQNTLPRVEIIANVGNPMRLPGIPIPVVCVMGGGVFEQDVTPILLEHNNSRRLGHTTEQSLTPVIKANGVLSCANDDVEKVKADAKNGFRFQASIGAVVDDGYILKPGQSATVNNKRLQGPLLVATKYRIREITLTAVGADGGTSVKIAAHYQAENNSMEFNDWIKSQGLDPTALTDDQKVKLEASWQQLFPTEPKKGGDPASTTTPSGVTITASTNTTVEDDEARRMELRRANEADEDLRLTNIRASFGAHEDVEEVEFNGKKYSVDEFRSHAIRANLSANDVELGLLRASRTRPTSFNNAEQQLLTEPEFRSQVIQASLCRSLGVPESGQNSITGQKFGLEEWFDNKVLQASATKEHNFYFLSDIFALNIQAAGLNAAGVSRRSEEFYQIGLRANEMLRGGVLQASGQFSTLSVSNILENVANKQLMAAFDDAEVIWSQIAKDYSVPDFKAMSFYRLTVDGGYVQIPPGGELKHGKFRDEKQTLSIDTHGMMLGLNRQDMINDDLGAFNSIPASLGRNAALALEFAVVAAMLDASYYSNSTNQISTDFGIAGLTAGLTKFRQRTDGNGKPIMVRPDRVVVGLQDAQEAEDLYTQRTLIATDMAASASTVATNNNPHVGRYRPLVTPIISETGLTGMDGKVISANVNTNQWFMLANPAIHPALRVGFLKGRKRPVIESSETSFNTLGMMWRSYFDFGTGEADDEYIVKSTGTG